MIRRTENGRKDEGDQEWSFYFRGGGRVGATGRLSHGRPLQAKCERASRQPSKVTSPQASVRVFYCIVVNTSLTSFNIFRVLQFALSLVMSIFPARSFFNFSLFSLLLSSFSGPSSFLLFLSFKISSNRTKAQHSLIPRSLHSGDSCIGIKVESHLQTHSLLYGQSPTHHLPFPLSPR